MSRLCSPYLTAISTAAALLLPVAAAASAQSDSARVEQLFMWASAGEIRFTDRVQPAKDSLGAMGATAARWMTYKLRCSDARERLTVADVYEKIGKVATPYVVPFLDSSGEDMPTNAARCLGRIADTAAVPPLIAQLGHRHYRVRSEVATALGKLKDPRATDGLVLRLDTDPDSDVRKSAAVALGAIANGRAAPSLLHALGDSFFGVRQSAQVALTQVKPAPVTQLMTLVDSASGVVQRGAVIALGGCVDKRAHRELLQLLNDPDPYLRGFAVEALSLHRDRPDDGRIARMMRREHDPFVLAQIDRYQRRD